MPDAAVTHAPLIASRLAQCGGRSRSGNGKARLRIAHVQLLPLLSGVQRVTLEELLALDPALFDRTLICQSPGPLTEAAAATGVRCVCVPELVRPIAPWRDSVALGRLTQLMRAHRFDVVHTHSSKTGVLGRLAGRISGVPAIVHTVHGFAFPAAASQTQRLLFSAMERLCGRCCDAVICLNDADRETAAHLGVLPERLHLIPNGVDLTRFSPLSEETRTRVRRHLGLPTNEPVAVMVGRLWPQKDPLTFVRAASELVHAGAPGHFLLIGDGRLRPEVERFVQRHGMADRVRLLGWRDDVAQLLPAFDVFVLPSHWEGMPLAILEAFASGLPGVVSDIPGNRDLVTDGYDGFLVPPGDAQTLANRLRVLLTDPARCREFGRAARAKAERDYPLSRRLEAVMSLYTSVLAGKGVPSAETLGSR